MTHIDIMKNEITASPEDQPLLSVRSILRTEWKWWLGGAVFCFLLASILISGWPAGLVPNLSHPFTYFGDGLSHAWMSQRAIEGWLFENPRSGYPFGSNFLDYPGSDGGNLLVLKIIGQFTGNPFIAINLYFLASFAVIFVGAYCVMRSLRIARPLAFAGAVIFDFIPFHFQRIDHLFYTWYFVAPVFFYVALRIANSSIQRAAELRAPPRWLVALGLVALGCFGVYYAVFGLIILTVVLLAALLGPTNFHAAKLALMAMCLVVLGVMLNIAPNIVHKQREGANLEVAQRSAVDSEEYAFKLVQLLLPRPDHHIRAFAKKAKSYNASFKPLNENFMSSLGFIGSVGFLGMFLVLCAAVAGRKIDRNLRLVALITLVLFMFGTLGGFGSLFSQIISASIRGWNRISIFVAFGALLVFFIVLQAACQKHMAGRRLALVATGAALILFGLFDQTVSPCESCNAGAKQRYELDRNFIVAIEKSLPAGSAVYQLPYVPFPESAPVFRLDMYDHAAAFLHSKTLKWSFAGMKGRAGDSFYRALSKETPEKQIEVIRRLGFAGVYIDGRGYEDNGKAIIARFAELLGQPPRVERADKEIVFFPLGPASGNPDELIGLSADELMARAGYVADRLGRRYEASLKQGIDFTRPDFPLFVKDINGLSGPEPWGRWTDAHAARSLQIDFTKPLPRRFTLVLNVSPFGPNAGQDLVVRIGTQTLSIKLHEGPGEYRQVVDAGGDAVSRIELVPARPASPKELGQNGDERKLGIGMIHLGIE